MYDINDIESAITVPKNNINDESNVLRCPYCYQIPFILIDNSIVPPILEFQCQNNHKIKENLKDLYKKSKEFQIDSIKCQCGKEEDILNISYCTKCFGFFCDRELHSLNDGHYLVPVTKFDSVCYNKNHYQNPVFYYCFNDKKNICNYCKQEEHKEHYCDKFIYLQNKDIDLLENDINNAKNILHKLKGNVNKILKKLSNLINEIDNNLKNYLQIHDIEFNLLQDLIKTYQLKKKSGNLNYQIICNIRNVCKFNKLDINFDNEEKMINNLKNLFNEKLKKFIIQSSKSIVDMTIQNINSKKKKNEKKKLILFYREMKNNKNNDNITINNNKKNINEKNQITETPTPDDEYFWSIK